MQHKNMDLLKQILINYHNSYSLEVAAKIIPEIYICVYVGYIFLNDLSYFETKEYIHSENEFSLC